MGYREPDQWNIPHIIECHNTKTSKQIIDWTFVLLPFPVDLVEYCAKISLQRLKVAKFELVEGHRIQTTTTTHMCINVLVWVDFITGKTNEQTQACFIEPKLGDLSFFLDTIQLFVYYIWINNCLFGEELTSIVTE